MMLSVKEAAAFARNDVTTIYEWVKRGKLKATNYPGTTKRPTMIDENDLMSYLLEREEKKKRKAQDIVEKVEVVSVPAVIETEFVPIEEPPKKVDSALEMLQKRLDQITDRITKIDIALEVLGS